MSEMAMCDEEAMQDMQDARVTAPVHSSGDWIAGRGEAGDALPPMPQAQGVGLPGQAGKAGALRKLPGALIGPVIIMGLVAALVLFAGDAGVSLRCPP